MKALFLALLFAVQQPDDVAQRIDAATQLVDARKIDDGIAALTKIVADHAQAVLRGRFCAQRAR